MPNPKPIEELKLKGTYRKDRHKKREETEIAFRNISSPVEIKVPDSITNEVIKKQYIEHVHQLNTLGILQPQDLQLLNVSYDLIQRAVDLQTNIDALEAKDALTDKTAFMKYERMTAMYLKIIRAYSDISTKFYVTPVARAKLILDSQTFEKNELEKKSMSQRLLEKKIV
jgi:hypothetical protein